MSFIRNRYLFSFARFDKKEVQFKYKNVDKIIKTEILHLSIY